MAQEAEIIINGQLLTRSQSITLRVALTQFHAELVDSKRREALGEIGPLYRASAWDILKIIIGRDAAST